MPRGLAVVGLDFGGVAEQKLGVIAIGQLGGERVSAGLAVGGVKCAFERKRLRLGEGFGAAGGFDVLVDNFLSVLGTGAYGERSQKSGGDQGRLADMHGVRNRNANSREKF